MESGFINAQVVRLRSRLKGAVEQPIILIVAILIVVIVIILLIAFMFGYIGPNLSGGINNIICSFPLVSC